MEVTEVRVFLVNEDKLKAYVTITFDDCFVVRDLKVIQGKAGLFVAMPSKKRSDGSFKDTAHPLNNETRGMIERAVLAEYRRVMAEEGDTQQPPGSYADEGGERYRDEEDDGDEMESSEEGDESPSRMPSEPVPQSYSPSGEERVSDDRPQNRGDFEID